MTYRCPKCALTFSPKCPECDEKRGAVYCPRCQSIVKHLPKSA